MEQFASSATWQFIAAHRDDKDVSRLSFMTGRGIDIPFALTQIEGYRIAAHKLPLWHSNDGIVYPPHISMEQCSGQAAAGYKARLAKKITGDGRKLLADLTGGLGVDFSFMAPLFEKAVYVERQQLLCSCAAHNMAVLGIDNAVVENDDAVEYLHRLQHADLIFLDPARRDKNGRKVVTISDCTPDVLAMEDELLSKADAVMIKLSPMLDVHAAVAALGTEHVCEVHVVAEGGECKELLFVLRKRREKPVTVSCADGDRVFSYSFDDSALQAVFGGSAEELAGMYLYVPNAAVMKAGGFAQLTSRYHVTALSANSHLFVSCKRSGGFPGREFVIDGVSTLNKKECRRILAGTDRANVSVRNFPMSADALRRRLRLADGGSNYIFGTTMSADGRQQHVLLLCHKPLDA